MMKYEVLILGQLETNCYLVWEEKTKKGIVIDPADDGVAISEEITARQIELMGIVMTHGHFDHCLAALDLKLMYQVPIFVSSEDKFLLERQNSTAKHFLKTKIETPNIVTIDKDLSKIKEVWIGKEKLEVIKTPGHTPGSVCLYSQKDKILFSGDTLFKQFRGRTDFAYGSTKKIYDSLKRLMKLPEETMVLSGHGEKTTIGDEKPRYVLDVS
ncbi:MBL fold metallo-hydrolase [Candidatus Shapirobacteria bacterium]|jgi:glyoxylase-like metal-dependent hydrolase (beta-lactamase superfamily II)|nr:MBL fold metallo-hydrolase [Candidatus Shapirobacteria bacterium]